MLHLASKFDEVEIAEWLLTKGMHAEERATVDRNGFGGFTPLLTAVVWYANRWGNFRGATPDATFGAMLLANGADPSIRALVRPIHPPHPSPKPSLSAT